MRKVAAEMGQKGSGLGQVTEREISLLINNIASLDTGQGPKQLRGELARIQSHFDKVAENFERLAGEASSANASASSGNPLDDAMRALIEQDPELGALLGGAIE